MIKNQDAPVHISSQLKVQVGQLSETGLKEHNEDCMGIRIPDEPLLTTKGIVAIIADGVSSAEAGKEASETCVRNFLSDYYSTPDAWSVKNSGQKVLTALNRWLYGQGQQYLEAEKGYISTLSILVIKSRQAHIFHIGDSRVYRLRDGELEQLTRDHSATISKKTSYLTRAMGMDIRLEIDYKVVDVEQGDVFFMSTDGVHDFVRHKDLADAVSLQDKECEAVCDGLIQAAKDNQSADNLTCQLIRIAHLPPADNQDLYQKLSELPFPPELAVGNKLDGFKVIKEIHASSRSQLYLVEDVDGKVMVMKTPSANFNDDPAYIERFVMERWIGKRINNSHVVKVIETEARQSCLYYLLEYVQGQSLGQWITENPKPAIQDVVRIIDQIGRGLQAFHRKETLHQDIKPENVIIDRNGSAIIVDFGACYVAGVNEISIPFQREVALGTVDYSAPEHHLQKAVGQASDIFSLGSICYEMLTGKLPYGEGLGQAKKPEDFQKLSYSPVHHHNPLVPPWLDAAIHKAVHISQRRRYQVLSEFSYDLHHPNAKLSRHDYQPLNQRNPVLLWQIFAGVELVVILGILYFMR